MGKMDQRKTSMLSTQHYVGLIEVSLNSSASIKPIYKTIISCLE